ncbi:ABC-2 type transport system permease protein [Streptoalloteichus tenebrarius]|uniref:ABC-2 type transport system permease protein n=1 Tax=Streptoalloteichus tenebrarius (strain ATCC 17920 / DSM 40477 / JCM 4838 / CBS 697.72 / NBRC 16177 / NCIMB 11028 / NRRL B-12390 / A12253. 1 / ISP 5477) TaxID=1933 RepID=A0ABT1HRF8_STRSD|nr:ABC transporter permease [Streptoalloteichus tenebrarius]MCP2258105.1 ABC-2 type transport system permease protein [Streptoalloteichus tenebrarius]BFF01779.1 ABC transporter permease [Streptoalloteichus tenebrarius]
MQSPSTVEQPDQAPPPAPSRSFARARHDLSQGWKSRQLWAHLGWQDIKQQYRRSVIGPLWITISMAVTATALGILYSGLMGQPLERQLPYVAVGFIVWNFIGGCVNEGANVFIANEGLIKHLPAPISVHVYRLVWRQTLLFLHNLVVYVAVLLIFPPWKYGGHISFSMLLAIPALVLLMINGLVVSMFVGIVSTRFRDIPPITGSVVQMLFFMTPVAWIYDSTLLKNSPRVKYAELNPFLHYVEMIRQPMLGQTIVWRHWAVVLVATVLLTGLAAIFLRNYRARVSYWV